MQVAVGKDVEAVCRKCGEVWHVIMAMDGSKITRVQCKQCMAYHRYRPPEGEARVDVSPGSRRKTAPATRTKTTTASSSRKKSSKKKSSRKASFDEPLVEPDLSRPIRPYKMSERYLPGDRVQHPKFGEGVVEMLPGDGKMNVFFEDGRRTLAHDR
ncbi:MAG: hypothetical protein H6712_03405 [Myxococcales bacterium]|nr:hypothetical protein [Myxococcales bacterium]MCB9712873.1 hypothetical protein [Myxococcales bacterium]